MIGISAGKKRTNKVVLCLPCTSNESGSDESGFRKVKSIDSKYLDKNVCDELPCLKQGVFRSFSNLLQHTFVTRSKFSSCVNEQKAGKRKNHFTAVLRMNISSGHHMCTATFKCSFNRMFGNIVCTYVMLGYFCAVHSRKFCYCKHICTQYWPGVVECMTN